MFAVVIAKRCGSSSGRAVGYQIRGPSVAGDDDDGGDHEDDDSDDGVEARVMEYFSVVLLMMTRSARLYKYIFILFSLVGFYLVG
ncbi:hypothetical protein PoB_003845000 [Plakobranchus ocellatus]|uniref:Uncharacterized protein n=1 Tax=Plakobranchus ocellatus TaxID=259542 RepID=A0AAV4AXF1_9GAST|nr:hypothetical protein PoB_003845000 [Plakobranchus ocellatus]